MKTFITTAAVLAVLSVPAFAEGDDASTKAGEAKGNLKASTEQKQEPVGSNAMGQGASTTRATTGAARSTAEETSSPANPGNKTGVTGGNDGGGSGSSGGSGSGGGSGGSGSR